MLHAEANYHRREGDKKRDVFVNGGLMDWAGIDSFNGDGVRKACFGQTLCHLAGMLAFWICRLETISD